MLTSRVSTSGPFFDGRTAHAVQSACSDFEREYAQHGYNLVHTRLRQVLKFPTGYYQSHIRTTRMADGWSVNDGGRIVYGPWLEGVGSRNFPHTRFKGYRTFRLVAQKMKAQAGPFFNKILFWHLAGNK